VIDVQRVLDQIRENATGVEAVLRERAGGF
jgi:hypothetical protein